MHSPLRNKPFTNTQMSDANREQVTSYLTSIWKNMVKDVAASRKISEDALNALADTYAALHPAAELIESGLADTLVYIDGAKSYLKKQMELDDEKSLTFVSPSEMANAEVPDYKEEDNKVAVYIYCTVTDKACICTVLCDCIGNV